MFLFICKRALLALLLLIAVNAVTFALFFAINSPEQMAQHQLGDKYRNQAATTEWLKTRGYDKPLFFNAEQSGFAKLTDTLFYKKSIPLLVFDFGRSDQGIDIAAAVKERAGPSLAIQLPTLIVGVLVEITFAILICLWRYRWQEKASLVSLIFLMSISGLFYIIFGQYLFSIIFKWFPISGYQDGWDVIRFVALPVIIGVLAGASGNIRWYRTLFLEEIEKDYVRTARAKGLSKRAAFFKHVLPNAMIPILTGIVAIVPSLFLGSLLMESFFAIPGLGSFAIDGIQNQDFAIVRAMVYLGAALYLLGLFLTDISYSIADPRVRL